VNGGAKQGKKGGRTAPGPVRRWFRRILWAGLLFVAALAAQHQHVVWGAAGRLYAVETVPERSAILVLGAQVWGGQPSHMLEDRLRATASLYHLGKAPVVLVSGDGRAMDYDEVGVMSAWLRDHGVPVEAIVEDRAGLRTLDSLYRARDEFGFADLIVVTNPFHVARSVFLGTRHGMDVVGVGAPHGRTYSRRTLWGNRAREVAARIWAWWDIFVLGTAAQVSGPAPEPVATGRR